MIKVAAIETLRKKRIRETQIDQKIQETEQLRKKAGRVIELNPVMEVATLDRGMMASKVMLKGEK